MADGTRIMSRDVRKETHSLFAHVGEDNGVEAGGALDGGSRTILFRTDWRFDV